MIGIQTNVFLVFEWIYIFVVSVIIIESDSRQKARLIFEKNETFLSTESKLRKKICSLWNNVTSWKNLRIKKAEIPARQLWFYVHNLQTALCSESKFFAWQATKNKPIAFFFKSSRRQLMSKAPDKKTDQWWSCEMEKKNILSKLCIRI